MYWMNEWTDQTRTRAVETRGTHIVVAVEQNQENTDGRREQKQPVLREHIGVQQAATVKHANFVLFFLIDAVEGGEIDIG